MHQYLNMPKKIFVFFFLALSHISFSQYYIDLSKAKSREKLEKIKSKSKVNIIINETANSLAYFIRDSSSQNLDYFLYFDKNGKCNKEVVTLSCDSCYTIFLKDILSNNFMRWTQVDSTTFLARFPYRLILNINPPVPFSYEITRSEMDGETYRKKVRQAL
ncbi:MAG: hypothetical protein WCO37_12505 [Bacteroidota bacterium]|jgi:hypothetical protein